MHYSSEQEILQTINQFNNKTLEKSAWTHAAHLTVGLWHVSNFPLDEAICRMRSGIISYNLAVGTENTGSGGYHETLTIFWLTILHHFYEQQEDKSLLSLCNTLLSSNLAVNTLPFHFYDRAKVLSLAARARFIAPDKVQITQHSVSAIMKNDISITIT